MKKALFTENFKSEVITVVIKWSSCWMAWQKRSRPTSSYQYHTAYKHVSKPFHTKIIGIVVEGALTGTTCLEKLCIITRMRTAHISWPISRKPRSTSRKAVKAVAGMVTYAKASDIWIYSWSVRRRRTIAYLVFHHDLLITKLHNIRYKITLMAYIVTKVGFMASR